MDNRRIRRKRVRRFIAYTLVILTGLITALAAWGYYLWKEQPQYWTENQTFLKDTPTQDVEKMALQAENMVLNLLSTSPSPTTNGQNRTRSAADAGGIEKQINLSTQQINAWLDRRLPAWASNRNIHLPDQISHLMIHPESGRVAVAFDYHKDQIQKVITLVFDISMVSKGKAMFHLTQLRGGSLPIKPSWLVNNINDAKLKRLTTEMIQGKVVKMTFPLPADSSKQVTVKQLAIHSKGLVADVVTK